MHESDSQTVSTVQKGERVKKVTFVITTSRFMDKVRQYYKHLTNEDFINEKIDMEFYLRNFILALSFYILSFIIASLNLSPTSIELFIFILISLFGSSTYPFCLLLINKQAPLLTKTTFNFVNWGFIICIILSLPPFGLIFTVYYFITNKKR